MMCGSCEAHVNDIIRRLYPKAKKVASSHIKNQTTFLIEEEVDESLLSSSIGETGYKVESITKEIVEEKKGFFARLFKK